jgi:hypothetical protein
MPCLRTKEDLETLEPGVHFGDVLQPLRVEDDLRDLDSLLFGLTTEEEALHEKIQILGFIISQI